MRLVALLVAILAFWFAYDSATVVDPSADDDGAHERRAVIVRQAIDAAIPHAIDFSPGGVSEVHGDHSRSGPRVSILFRVAKSFDWRNVTFPPDAEGGPVQALLQQADRHREVLQSAGFQAIRARGWGSGATSDNQPPRVQPPGPTPDAPPGLASHRPSVHITVRHTTEGPAGGGRGSGGYLFDLNDPRLIHHRVHVHPQSGAVVFTRIEFDQESRRARVEFTYSDRTIMGADYGESTYTLDEWIE